MALFHRIAPFELEGQAETRVTLDDYLGRYLVLYFYPRANTSGCTRQAQELTAILPELDMLDAAVLGVSPDKLAAQARFIEQKELGVTMASDPKLELARRLGAVKPTGGVLRSTFVIDRVGAIRWQKLGVKVAGHAEEVLDMVRAIREADEELSPVIVTRRACRAITRKKIGRKRLKRLIEAAALAPSCYNNQPWRFVVVEKKPELEAVKAGLSKGNAWALQAPAIIAVTSTRDLDCKLPGGRDYFLFDSGLATQNLMLQATQMGLVAHPIAGFSPKKVKKALAIPDQYVLIAMVVVGAPVAPASQKPETREQELAPRERTKLDAVMAWNSFGQLAD